MESTVLDTNVTALFSTNMYIDEQNFSTNSNLKDPRDNSIAILVGIGRLVEVYLPYTKVSISTIIKDDMNVEKLFTKFVIIAETVILNSKNIFIGQ